MNLTGGAFGIVTFVLSSALVSAASAEVVAITCEAVDGTMTCSLDLTAREITCQTDFPDYMSAQLGTEWNKIEGMKRAFSIDENNISWRWRVPAQTGDWLEQRYTLDRRTLALHFSMPLGNGVSNDYDGTCEIIRERKKQL